MRVPFKLTKTKLVNIKIFDEKLPKEPYKHCTLRDIISNKPYPFTHLNRKGRILCVCISGYCPLCFYNLSNRRKVKEYAEQIRNGEKPYKFTKR